MLLGGYLRQQARRDEIAVARGGEVVAAPRQVDAAICRIVHADYSLTREESLDTEIPLINIGVLVSAGAQIICVRVAPFRELTVLFPLRPRQTSGKRVTQRGVLGRKIVTSEKHRRALAECRSRILEVRSHAQAVIHPCATANHCVRRELVSKAESGTDIVAVNGDVSPS